MYADSHREWQNEFELSSNSVFLDFDAMPTNPRYRSPDLAIRDGKWKLLVNDDGSGTELYNIETDVAESVNLAKQNPEIAKRLSQQLIFWWQAMPK